MNAILAAFGEVPFIKVCIAVDEDVDIFNIERCHVGRRHPHAA